jgi:hypothetical protein
MERPFLEIHRPARIERETVRGVMRVRGIETVNKALFHVVLVVAVGVFQEDDVRAARRAPRRCRTRSRWVMEVVGEDVILSARPSPSVSSKISSLSFIGSLGFQCG